MSRRRPGETAGSGLGSARGVSLSRQGPIPQAQAVTVQGRPAVLNAARGGVGWGCREPPFHTAGPSPALKRTPARPESCAWGRLRCSPGSWLGVALYGPKAITHSGRPLPLCPFSQLPAVPGASSAKKQPQKKKKGKCSTKSKAAEMAPAEAAQPPSGKEEEHGAVKAPAGGGVPQKAQAKLRKHRGAPALQQTPLAALWSSSSETSLPEERTYSASAAVPLMHRRTRSLQSQPPKTKAGLPRRGMSCPR